jgi:ABC-type xylose transport system permease subunit
MFVTLGGIIAELTITAICAVLILGPAVGTNLQWALASVAIYAFSSAIGSILPWRGSDMDKARAILRAARLTRRRERQLVGRPFT